jgi:hypothetical protein
MHALHAWTFTSEGDSTIVETTESLWGWFPRILKLVDPYFLDTSLSQTLKKLEKAALSQEVM